MQIVMTERWEYTEYAYWEVEELPEGWDEWETVTKHKWVLAHGEYNHVEADPNYMIDVEDVEVR